MFLLRILVGHFLGLLSTTLNGTCKNLIPTQAKLTHLIPENQPRLSGGSDFLTRRTTDFLCCAKKWSTVKKGQIWFNSICFLCVIALLILLIDCSRCITLKKMPVCKYLWLDYCNYIIINPFLFSHLEYLYRTGMLNLLQFLLSRSLLEKGIFNVRHFLPAWKWLLYIWKSLFIAASTLWQDFGSVSQWLDIINESTAQQPIGPEFSFMSVNMQTAMTIHQWHEYHSQRIGE